MNEREFEESVREALSAAVPRDPGFWARQRAQIISRLPERRSGRSWGWAWAPFAAAALATLLLWSRRPVAPAVPVGLLRDMDIVQDLDMAEDLDLLEDLDRMGEKL